MTFRLKLDIGLVSQMLAVTRNARMLLIQLIPFNTLIISEEISFVIQIYGKKRVLQSVCKGL